LITAPDATVAVIVAINMALNFAYCLGMGATYAFLCEAFPASVRSSGLGLVYALGVTIFGSTTQFAVAWLIDRTGDPTIPAWYMMTANFAAIVGIALLRPHEDLSRERAAHATARA
jgi:uncharacterized membrane protein